MKNCLNPKCNKEFTPKNKKGVYCSSNCRAAHSYQLKNSKIPLSVTYYPDLKEGVTYSFSEGKLTPIKEQLNVTLTDGTRAMQELIEDTKEGMPSGLSLGEQIQWKIDNE